MPDAEHVFRARNELGEGPIWHASEQALYWTDIERAHYHRFHPGTGAHEIVRVGQKVGALAFRKSGGLVLAAEHGFAIWEVSEGKSRPFGEVSRGEVPTRFNDGAVDARGRFWAGTLVGETGNSLYRLDANGTIRCMDTGFGIPNGIGWSLDNRVMYFTDSATSRIYAYAFELETGEIRDRRVLVDSSERPGVPDGLTVDAEDHLWSARWEAGCVERYDPEGKLVLTVNVPARYPTSVAFGGPELSDLYITSALLEVPPAERVNHPVDGDLFRFKCGVKGREEYAFAG